jgi:hypothetical protein
VVIFGISSVGHSGSATGVSQTTCSRERFMSTTVMSASCCLHLITFGSAGSFYDICKCCDT